MTMPPAFARALAAVLAVATTAPPALAGKLLVLKSEGKADAKVRARVDATVAKLAQGGTDEASPGDITLTDAADMVGCKSDEARCREDIIGMLAVDAIVIVTVSPKAGEFDVKVRRVGRRGASREASALVSADGLDRLDAIAPLFGASVLAPEPPTPPAPPPTPPPAATVAVTPPTEPPGDFITPPVEPASSEPSPAAVQAPMTLPPRDLGPPHPNRRLHIAGMVTGGTFIVLGSILWGSAASVASELDAAPTATAVDIQNLQDLEARGDAYAGLGNVLVLGGLVVGGVSTYLYLRGKRRTSAPTSARLIPSVIDGGTGFTLTLGGTL